MTSDIWLGGQWRVYTAQAQGGMYVKPAGRMGTFNLRAITDPESGDRAYYRIAPASCDMPDCWRVARFYPVGRNPTSLPGSTKLKPWSEGVEGEWNAAANSVLQAFKANPDTKRLEATIRPVGDDETLILLLVENVVEDGTGLLVVQLNGAPLPAGRVAMREDGTAHGSGPHA